MGRMSEKQINGTADEILRLKEQIRELEAQATTLWNALDDAREDMQRAHDRSVGHIVREHYKRRLAKIDAALESSTDPSARVARDLEARLGPGWDGNTPNGPWEGD